MFILIYNTGLYSIYFRKLLNMSLRLKDGKKKYTCQKDGCKISFQTISGCLKHFNKCSLPTINLKGYQQFAHQPPLHRAAAPRDVTEENTGVENCTPKCL